MISCCQLQNVVRCIDARSVYVCSLFVTWSAVWPSCSFTAEFDTVSYYLVFLLCRFSKPLNVKYVWCFL